MANLPGCYLQVNLGASTLQPPTTTQIDITNLNFALVMCEDDTPVQQRFTTWGMRANSAMVYQQQTSKNQIIIGYQGNIYLLDEDTKKDTGITIPLRIETVSLPEVDPSTTGPITGIRRMKEIYWQTNDTPPSSGYQIKLTLVDEDDSTNFVIRNILQYTNKMRVPMSIKCRQFRIIWELSVGTDFDIISYGYTFQNLERPYTKLITS